MTEMTPTRTLEVVAAEIRTFTASMLNNIIEIGRRLCEAKELVPYGQFGSWVKENTGYSSSTANNFMRLFQEYGAAQGSLFGAEVEDVQTFGKLSYTKALALLQLPAGEREEFVRENDVDAMSTRELEQAIRERDEARAKAEAVEQLRADAVKDVEELERYNAKLDDELAKAKEQIAELESRPVEVAVQQPDPAVIQQQIDAAVKTAKAEAAADRKKLKDKLDAAQKAQEMLTVELENQKKAAAKKEKELTEQQAGVTSIEKERLEREIAELKKQLAMSDAEVIKFNEIMTEAQGILNRLIAAMEKTSDEENAGRFRAAVRRLLDVYREKVGDG